MRNEPFWMVYGAGQGAPTVMHETRDIALAEAKRLASLNPGIAFYVLEAVAVAQKVDVAVRDLREPSDDLPF